MRKKEVMIVTGAGQISMAIARRVGYGKKIVMGDKNIKNAKAIAEIMNNAGFDVEPVENKPVDHRVVEEYTEELRKHQEETGHHIH